MKILAVIWDVGGVLLRTENPIPRQKLADRLQISRSELEQIVFDSVSSRNAQLGEITAEQHWENVGRMLNLQLEEMGEIQREFWGGDIVDYDLVDTIRSLQRAAFKTGILSNAFSSLRKFVVSEIQIGDAFDEIIISAEVGLMKPDPRIYQFALARMGVDPGEAVFIDDSQGNILAACELGMHAFQFRTPEQTHRELEALLDGRVG